MQLGLDQLIIGTGTICDRPDQSITLSLDGPDDEELSFYRQKMLIFIPCITFYRVSLLASSRNVANVKEVNFLSALEWSVTLVVGVRTPSNKKRHSQSDHFFAKPGIKSKAAERY